MVAAIVLAKLTMMVCILYTLLLLACVMVELHSNIADPGPVVLANWGFLLCRFLWLELGFSANRGHHREMVFL
jgi:hypothetical protein